MARNALHVEVEIVTGQPPWIGRVAGQDVELRYFFCGLIHGEAVAEGLAAVRWIPKAHLREYDFDALSRPVVDWLLEHEGW